MLFSGCNIVTLPSSSQESFCHFDPLILDRPDSKGDAVFDGVVGGSLMGTAGVITVSQIGTKLIYYK
jgi:hypothetical protein